MANDWLNQTLGQSTFQTSQSTGWGPPLCAVPSSSPLVNLSEDGNGELPIPSSGKSWQHLSTSHRDFKPQMVAVTFFSTG